MELITKATAFSQMQARKNEVTLPLMLRDFSAAGLVLVSIVPVASSRLSNAVQAMSISRIVKATKKGDDL